MPEKCTDYQKRKLFEERTVPYVRRSDVLVEHLGSAFKFSSPADFKGKASNFRPAIVREVRGRGYECLSREDSEGNVYLLAQWPSLDDIKRVPILQKFYDDDENREQLQQLVGYWKERAEQDALEGAEEAEAHV